MYTTFPNKRSAQAMAKELVAKKLAACVVVGSPVESYFVWNSKPQKSKEIPIWIKLVPSQSKGCKAYLLKKHPYTTPGVFVWNVNSASAAYSAWAKKGAR